MLKIFNKFKKNQNYILSNSEKLDLKEKFNTSYYQQNAKDALTFELNKEKVDLKLIESIMCEESQYNPQLTKLKKLKLLNFLSPIFTFGIMVVILNIIKSTGGNEFLAIPVAMITLIISGFSILNGFYISADKDKLEYIDEIRKEFLNILIKNKNVKNSLLKELKESLSHIDNITNGNKNAVNSLGELYYNIEEIMLEKGDINIENLEDDLDYFYEIEEKYLELYSEEKEVETEVKLLESYY